MYKNKYLKYKSKYIELKNQLGGLIGEYSINSNIPIEQLDSKISKHSIPDKLKKYVNLITIPNSIIIRVGSSMLKIQPYFSDVDIMNVVYQNLNIEDYITFFINNIKNIITNISTVDNAFFSDFKAGGYHWSIQEILNEQKNDITLREALKKDSVVKLDIIGPYDERYLEMSTFYVLKYKNGYINFGNNDFATSLMKDINNYSKTKIFKAIKRVWSLASLNKDGETLNKLKIIIKSSIALLSQINADIETIELLIEHGSSFDINFVINELDKFKERFSHIIDIKYNEALIDTLIEKLILLFKYDYVNNKQNILDTLKDMHDYILSIINKETIDYLKSINFTFPSFNLPNNVENDFSLLS